MSACAWILALAATLGSGGVGLASAAIVASLTKAPRLRYVACTAALVFALTPLSAPLLLGFGLRGDHLALSLAPTHLAGSAKVAWANAAQSPSWVWGLARSAPVLLAAYAAGVAACVARLSWRCLALRRVLQDSRALDPAGLKGVAAPPLPVRVADRAASALLIGVRRPVAVLPARALEQMTAAQLHWVLAHEAAHARRGDNLRLLAEGLLGAVLWFNPFVTWATMLAAEAREQLCDQAVLSGAGASERRAYAETLLLALRLGSQAQVASMLIPHGKRRLSMRLKAIMHPARPTPAKAVASFGAIAAAGLVTFAVGAAAWAQTPPSIEGPARTTPPTEAAAAPGRGLTLRLVDDRGAFASQPVVSGVMVAEATAVSDRQGRSIVKFRLTPEGASRLAAVTRANIGRRLAIMVDGEVISEPVIRAEIKGGVGEISGDFTPAKAKQIAETIVQGRIAR